MPTLRWSDLIIISINRRDQKTSAPELAEKTSENESNQDKTAGKKTKKRPKDGENALVKVKMKVFRQMSRMRLRKADNNIKFLPYLALGNKDMRNFFYSIAFQDLYPFQFFSFSVNFCRL